MNKRFSKIFSFFKGVSRDPFLYLWLSALVLFGLISLGSGFFINFLSEKGSFSLATLSRFFDKGGAEDLFGQIKSFSPESPEFIIVGDSGLKSATPPTTFSPQILGALVGGYEIEDTKKIITEYIVEEGDSLWSISAKFNISLNTILWANNLSQNSILKLGQKLIILPVSGVVHHVKAGDTISEIAKMYKGKTEEIISFNNLSGEGDIFVGDIVIVPNGVMSQVSQPQYAPQWVPLAQSFFICPISAPCRITQGLHWYNAIDFSHGKCGESIYAAAAGQILKVKLTNSTSRWANGGAGNYLTILHPNGVVTMYGHIAVSLVNPGDTVSQGQIIALVGGQSGTPGAGLSSGCHLHFGVSGARNPFSR